MKKNNFLFLIFIMLFFSNSNANKIYIPPGACITVPTGIIICTDTVYVDSSACLILADSLCICPGIKILGEGTVLIKIENNHTEIPKMFELYQNYPNPFNPTTKIRFALPITSNITLTIFDVLGKEVAALVNDKLQPGTYEFEWNGTNYPSGVYFYKFISGNFIDTKKMVIIK